MKAINHAEKQALNKGTNNFRTKITPLTELRKIFLKILSKANA